MLLKLIEAETPYGKGRREKIEMLKGGKYRPFN